MPTGNTHVRLQLESWGDPKTQGISFSAHSSSSYPPHVFFDLTSRRQVGVDKHRKLTQRGSVLTRASTILRRIFTARRYASALYAVALCPTVRPSEVGVLTKRLNTNMITLTAPHDSTCTLVFGCQRSRRNAMGHPQRCRRIQVR